MGSVYLGDISIDCAEPERTRDFYVALTGWDQQTMYNCPALITDNGLVILFMLCDFDFIPPIWPEEHDKQQTQMHFNFGVDELSSTLEIALKLGATMPKTQYGGKDYVTLCDPEGHPFCLC